MDILKPILQIYDVKKPHLLYYLDDKIRIQVEGLDFLDDGHELFLNDMIYCIHKSTLELEHKGKVISVLKNKVSIKEKYTYSVHLNKTNYHMFIKRKKNKKNDRDFYKALLNTL